MEVFDYGIKSFDGWTIMGYTIKTINECVN